MSTEQVDVGQGESDNDTKETGVEQAQAQAASPAGLKFVRTKLEDPQFEAAELLRIITGEIATVATRMRSLGFTKEEAHIGSCLAKQVEVLRQLAQEVRNVDLVRTREDTINFDGPKFKFVMDKVMDMFIKAMQAAGVEEGQRNNIFRYLRDLFAENEDQLLRETAAVGKKGKAPTAC